MKQRKAIRRMLRPSSFAIVGASDRQANLLRLAEYNEANGVDIYLVNPRYSEVYGRRTYSSLQDIGHPVDAVLSMVNAEASIGVIEDAALAGIGGIVVSAAGFAETDEAGRRRQLQLANAARAADLAVCGPNCNGLLNVPRGFSMYYGPIDEVRAGGVAVLSQSGGLLTDSLSAGEERRIGFSSLVATGNEAVTDLVDYLDYLIDDEDTTAVTMIIEQIRRPAEFLKVAYRARAAGKALIALKLGTSDVGKSTGMSHTGALVGNPREYEAAFRHVGVLVARDLDDLFDQALMFSSLPRDKWRGIGNIAVLTASGGDASLASDTFGACGIRLPVDESLSTWAHDLLPTNPRGNPLDITGVQYNESGFKHVLDKFVTSPVYDTVLVVSRLGPSHEAFARPLTNPVVAATAASDKRLIVTSAISGRLGQWTAGLIEAGIGVGRGITATTRSLMAMDQFVRTGDRPQPAKVTALSRPTGMRTVVDGQSTLVSFADAMDLLNDAGVPIAPYAVLTAEDLAADSTWLPSLDGLPSAENYVVKIADVLHRTEMGAVRTGVQREHIVAEARKISILGTEHGSSADVVVQPQLKSLGETFVGVQADSAFGPMVVFGLGGVFVEMLGDITARLAPMATADARDMLRETAGWPAMTGVRGQQPWNLDALADILVAVSQFAAANTHWLSTVDINPLLVTRDGFAAVDVAAIAKG